MKKAILTVVLSLFVLPLNVWCANDCAQFKSFLPQSTPEGTYRLELDMMKQGAYCYDIPIFDPQWQAMAAKNSTGNEEFKDMADQLGAPTKTFREGKYAIIYFPEDKTLGPTFLYEQNGKWILDRSGVLNYIDYDEHWVAFDGNYPYLDLMRKVFDFEEMVMEDGMKVYKVK